VIVNADGSGEHVLDVGRVSPCQDVNEPSWIPDGTRIAFTLVIGPFDQPGESATSAVLWTAKLDGTDVRRLSEPGIDGQLEDGHARFSPDGSFLIFERGSSITFDAAVFRMDIDGTNVRQLTPIGLGADTADLSQATSGPTKDLVVFETYGHGGPPSGAREDVATVPTTCLSVTECTSQIRYITANGSGPKDSDNPAWSPDGTQIAFVEYVHPAVPSDPHCSLSSKHWSIMLRLRAWSRCHPVSSHNSSRTLALTARDDDRYRVAVAFVTALRWLIVSPMSEAGPSPTGKRRRHAVDGHFYMRQRSLLRGHLW